MSDLVIEPKLEVPINTPSLYILNTLPSEVKVKLIQVFKGKFARLIPWDATEVVPLMLTKGDPFW